MEQEKKFNPRIVAFLCNWCTYTGADLAGVARMESSASVRVIRTMCSGRVDPTFVLKAFKLGADGVFIGGCHIGDCHYAEGNYKTLRRNEMLKMMLEQFGIDPRRLRLEWISAAEGDKWAHKTMEFERELREMGPLELIEN